MKLTLKNINNFFYDIDLYGNSDGFKFSNTLSSFSLIGNYEGDINTLQNYLLSIDNIGSYVEKLDDYCFYNCKNLDYINNLNNIKKFGNYCFYNCEKLNIQNSINHFNYNNPLPTVLIGDCAFYNTNFTKINIQLSSLKYFKDEDYQGSKLTDLNNGPYVGISAFANCQNLTDVKFSKTTEIGDYMFADCHSLSSVELISIGSYAGQYAFKNCISLNSIELPTEFEIISKGMFDGCASLRSITFKDPEQNHRAKFSSIEDYAFNKCNSLVSITFPTSLTSINSFSENSFKGSNLLSVYLPGVEDDYFSKQYLLLSNDVDIEITPDKIKYIDLKKHIISDNNLNIKSKFLPGFIYTLTDSAEDINTLHDVFFYAKKQNIPMIIWQIAPTGSGASRSMRQTVLENDKFIEWVDKQPFYFFEYTGKTSIPFLNEYHSGDTNIFLTTDNIYRTYDFNFQNLHQSYTIISFLWFKKDGGYVAEQYSGDGLTYDTFNLQKWKDVSENLFGSYSKFSDVYELEKLDDLYVNKKTIILPISKKFNGLGLDHECLFITKGSEDFPEGRQFLFKPALSASFSRYSIDDHEDVETLISLSSRITFLDDKENEITSFIVPYNEDISYYEPCMYNLSTATVNDPKTISANMLVDTYAGSDYYLCHPYTFAGWTPEISSDNNKNFIYKDTKFIPQYKNTNKCLCFDNLGNIIVNLDIPVFIEGINDYNKYQQIISEIPLQIEYSFPKLKTIVVSVETDEDNILTSDDYYFNVSKYYQEDNDNISAAYENILSNYSNDIPEFVTWCGVAKVYKEEMMTSDVLPNLVFKTNEDNEYYWSLYFFLNNELTLYSTLENIILLVPIFSNYHSVYKTYVDDNTVALSVDVSSFIKDGFIDNDEDGFGFNDQNEVPISYYHFPNNCK